jgi:hypothetical protein
MWAAVHVLGLSCIQLVTCKATKLEINVTERSYIATCSDEDEDEAEAEDEDEDSEDR